jgi:hypothetical protein
VHGPVRHHVAFIVAHCASRVARARRPLGLALGAAVVLAGAGARAQAGAADAVDVLALRGGGMLRGHVTEIDPAHAATTIVLLNGATRVVPTGDILDARGPAYPARGEAPSTPAAPGGEAQLAPIAVPPRPSAPTPGEEYLHPAPDRVPVHLESPRGAQLVGVMVPSFTARGHRGVTSNYLCFTPCTLYARPGSFQVEVGGEETSASTPTFEVPDAGLRVTVHARRAAVEGALFGVYYAGTWTLTGGGAMLLVAAGENGPHEERQPLLLGGAVVGLLGVGLIAAGITLEATNPSGVAAVSPLPRTPPAAQPAVALGVAPRGDGAVATLGVRF